MGERKESLVTLLRLVERIGVYELDVEERRLRLHNKTYSMDYALGPDAYARWEAWFRKRGARKVFRLRREE